MYAAQPIFDYEHRSGRSCLPGFDDPSWKTRTDRTGKVPFGNVILLSCGEGTRLDRACRCIVCGDQLNDLSRRPEHR